jgi:F-type H+-transporting ATPase subunit a
VLARVGGGAAAAEPGQALDFIGHVANGDHPLLHLPPIFGIDFSISKHVFMLLLVGAGLCVVVPAIVRGSIRSGRLVPTGAANALEIVVLWVRDSLVRPNVGDKWVRVWTPMLLTLFLFILLANGIGLVPMFEVLALADKLVLHSGPDSIIQHAIHGGSTATSNYNVTAAFATITFVAIILAGTMAHGFVKHWMNMVPRGVPWPLYFLLIPLEIIGLFVRPFALTMRLAANMTGGHIAILAILSFVFTFTNLFGATAGLAVGFGFSLPLAAAIYGLEIIVVIVQAYVFTLLSAVFIGMAIHAHH